MVCVRSLAIVVGCERGQMYPLPTSTSNIKWNVYSRFVLIDTNDHTYTRVIDLNILDERLAAARMFRNSFQQGFLSIFNIVGSNPLAIWQTCVCDNGICRRLTDEDINSSALELTSPNVTTTFITAPAKPHESLAIKLPFFIISLKNLNRYFSFEIQVLDDTNCLRRFRLSNFQSKTRVNCFGAQMPLALQPGWNIVQINLADFTRRAYGTNFIETTRVQVNANVRIRRIYFADRLWDEGDKPEDYQLPIPAVRECRVHDSRKVEQLKQPAPPPSPSHTQTSAV